MAYSDCGWAPEMINETGTQGQSCLRQQKVMDVCAKWERVVDAIAGKNVKRTKNIFACFL